MTISELIEKLERIKSDHGDLDVVHSVDHEMNYVSFPVVVVVTEYEKSYLGFFPGNEIDIYDED